MHIMAFYFSQPKHLQICKGLSNHEKGLSDLDHSKMYGKLPLLASYSLKLNKYTCISSTMLLSIVWDLHLLKVELDSISDGFTEFIEFLEYT